MQENLVRMTEKLQAQFGKVETQFDPTNQAKFGDFARSLVYGGVQQGTTSKAKKLTTKTMK